jgi:uncharacterized protein YodC (DUF2158 family)
MPQTGLAVGDVVRLKSGGPKMTVTDITSGTVGGTQHVTVECTWFHDNKQDFGKFPSETLIDASRDQT